MKSHTTTLATLTVIFVGLLAIATPALGAPKSAKDPARYAPQDALFVVSIADATKLTEKFKSSTVYELYKDPAMQNFLVPAEKNIRKVITETLENYWKQAGVTKAPVTLEDFPWPTGSAMLVLRSVTKTIKRPIYDYEGWKRGDGRPPIKDYRDRKITRNVFTVVLEMGDNAPAAKRLLKKITKAATNKGLLRKSETMAGTKVITLSFIPKPPKATGDSGQTEQNLKPVMVTGQAWKGKKLIIGNDAKLMKDVLSRMSGKKRKSIGSSKDYKKIFRKIGKGDVNCYLNIRQIVTNMIERAPMKMKPSISLQMESLGVAGMKGLGASLTITPNKPVESKLKALISIYGEKKGLATLIVPEARSTTANSLLTKGLVMFIVSNHDLGKVYDQAVKLVSTMSPFDINAQAAQMMKATSKSEGEAPVDLRKDICGQLTGPVTFTIRYKKPYTDPGSSQMTVAIGTQDAAKLDNAIGRIHSTFIKDKKKQRQLHKRTIYVLPAGGPFDTRAAEGQDPAYTALAVTDNNLVVSNEKGVEQAIRSIGGKGRKSIKTDRMYQMAARYLPSTASIYYYGNERINMAKTWVNAKKAGKLSDSKSTRQHALSMASLGQQAVAMRMLEKHCDFSTLPDFDAVKKYFGATVAHVNHVEEGIYLEFCTVKGSKAE